MKIALMDGMTVDVGDLSWDGLREFGDVVKYDTIVAHSDAVPLIGDADIAIGSKLVIDARVMDACPNLKYIGVPATGYNLINVDDARARGIAVTNVPTYGTESVAQHIFALLLDLTNKVTEHFQAVLDWQWTRVPSFCFWNSPLTELAGKTFCVYGFGKIGRQACKIAQAFGMKTIAVAHHPESTPPMEGVEFVDAENAFRISDVLSLNCPLTAETERLIRRENLAKMKPTVLVINTARGQLVDENDMLWALENDIIAGFGTDVVAVEPMLPGNVLVGAKNCIITPHIAWVSKEARQRLLDVTVDNLAAWLRGERVNRLD